MSKVTSKLQVTLPKAVAQQYGITPGSEVEFEPSGSVIVLRPAGAVARLTPAERLALFDEATTWVLAQPPRDAAGDRGWTREELYDRAVAR